MLRETFSDAAGATPRGGARVSAGAPLHEYLWLHRDYRLRLMIAAVRASRRRGARGLGLR